MLTLRKNAVLLSTLCVGSIVIYGARTNETEQRGKFAAARGMMTAQRSDAASVLLKNGRVLIIGGSSSRGVLATAETYDSSIGFSPAASMAYPRAEHAAALLPDGNVLVAGGRSNSGAVLSDTEIYDVQSNVWSAGPDMLSPHAGAALVTLRDGRILLAGGDSGSGASDRIEIYNPKTNSFSHVDATLSSPRKNHAAAILPNGSVLIGGGTNGEAALATVDLFDPATGKVTPAGSLSIARSALTATPLLNGRVLFAGGNTGKADVAIADLYDSKTGKFTVESALMTTPRSGHLAIRLPNSNTVTLLGGSSNGVSLASAETYIPWRHTFQSGATMSTGRTHAMVARLSQAGKIVAMGGAEPNAIYGDATCVPTITTDKSDYAPGTPVTFTGDCWAPGGTVSIAMTESPDIDQPTALTATVADDGTFTATGFSPDNLDIGVAFAVTATEPDPSDSTHILTAQTSFTDGALSIAVTGSLQVTGSPALTPATCTSAVGPCSSSVSGSTAEVLTASAPASWNIPSAIHVSTGCGSGSTSCTVTRNDSANATVTVSPANLPTLTSAALGSTTYIGNNTVTLTGTNFSTAANGAVINFGSTQYTVTCSSATSCQATIGAAGVGTYAVSITTNSSTTSSVNVTVSPASLSITANNDSKTYGQTKSYGAGSTAFGSSGLQNGETVGSVTLASAGAVASAGVNTYPITPSAATGGTFNANNYTIAYNNGTLTVNKATATVVVTPYSVTYNGQAHTASVGTITGVNGETGSTVGTVDVSHTSHTNANTYTTDYWTLTGAANYNDIAAQTITDTISKATASVTVTPYNVTYNGQAHTASVGTITGVNGETGTTVGTVDVSHTSHTAAGTYISDFWTLTGAANYSDITAQTITDTISKATPSVTVTPYSLTYDGQSHTASVGTITGVNGETGSTVGSVDVSHTSHTNANTYAADYWTLTGTANYSDITAQTITDTISKATASVTVTPYSVTYNGQPHAASVGTITGVNGETGSTVGTVDVSHTSHTNANTYTTDYWTLTGAANYSDITAQTITDTISKATASVIVTPYSVTYNGQPHAASVGTITGVNGETGSTVGSVDVSHTSHTNANTYTTDYWTLTGAANYSDITAQTITDTISKATASVIVTPYSVTYNGQSHTASVGTITGVNSETGSTVGTVDVSHTTHTDAGTFNADYWTFTGAGNYSDITAQTITDSIAKSSVTATAGSYGGTYDGFPHSPQDCSVTGAYTGNLSCTNSPASVGPGVGSGMVTPLIAGDNQANFSIATTNGSWSIGPASASVTVTPYSLTFDGSAHTASVVATGVGGLDLSSSVDVTATTHTTAGDYNSDAWSFNAGGNYLPQSGTVHDHIAHYAIPACPTLGCGVDNNNHLNPGVSVAIDATAAYQGTVTATVSMSPTALGSFATLNPLVQGDDTTRKLGVYLRAVDTGNNNTPGGNAIGLGSAVAILTTDPGGNYYKAVITGALPSTVAPGAYEAFVYGDDGGGVVAADASYTSPDTTNFTYATAASNVLAVNKATQTINFGALLNRTYGDASFGVSATGGASGNAVIFSVGATDNCTISANTVTITGAGSCTVTANQAGNDDYEAAPPVSQTFSIAKADAMVTVHGYTGIYDATAHGATGTATGVGGVDLSSSLSLGATFTDVPGGTANWTFNGGANYNNQSGSVGITINKADANVIVNGYTGAYDGAAHGASGTATGVGGTDLSSSLNLGATYTNVPGGTANWTFSGGTNYNNQSGSVAITINKADATVTVNGYTGTFDNSAHGAAGTATGVGGANLNSSLNLGATFTNVPGGTANWTFSGGTNYNNQSGSVAITINKADAIVSVGGYTGTYDGSAHGANGTATGIGGVNLNSSLNLGATFTNVPGGSANWTFSGGTNYNDQNGSVAITINKATSSAVVTGGSYTYDGLSHAATVSVTGVGLNTTGTPTYSGSCTAAPVTVAQGTTCTATYSYPGDSNHSASSSSSAAVTITKKAASVTPNAASKFYSQPDPSLTGTVGGFVSSDGVTAAYSRVAGTAVGTYTISAQLSPGGVLGNYNITYNTAVFTISADTTLLTYTGPISSTYGLCNNVNLTAKLVDTITGLPVSGASISFTLGTQGPTTAVTDANGVATLPLSVTQNAGNLTVSAAFAGTSTLAPSNGSVPYTINPSSNVAPVANGTLYTGPLFVWTSSSTNNTASVTLSTTVQDLGCGDIRTAKVTFATRTGTGAWTAIPSATNLSVGLVSPTVPSVGTASAIVQLSTGNSTYNQFDIAVILGGSGSGPGNYNLNNPAYDQIITVAEPGKAAQIIGNGNVDLNGAPPAAGYLATGAGTANSAIPGGPENYMRVAAGVTYNKSFTNPQGKVTLYINTYNRPDGTVDTALHTYMIQSNAISGLTAPVAGEVFNFTGKATVVDVTNPSASVSVDGGATFQMTTVNAGQKYNGTTYPNGGVMVEVQAKSGNVWIASGWSGTQPQMKPQVTGNIAGN